LGFPWLKARITPIHASIHRPAAIDDQQQGFYGGLPCRCGLIGLGAAPRRIR
jgi:hypothetical protein